MVKPAKSSSPAKSKKASNVESEIVLTVEKQSAAQVVVEHEEIESKKVELPNDYDDSMIDIGQPSQAEQAEAE